MDDDRPSHERPRSRHTLLRVIVAAILLLAVLLIDLAPAVPAPAAPTGAQAERSREIYRSVRDALGSGRRPVPIRVAADDLSTVTALASRLDRIGRVAAQVDGNRLQLWASRRLLGPLWVNIRAEVAPSRSGFPPVWLRIGRLPLGETLSHWLIDGGAAALRARGMRLPPLDRAVGGLRIEPDAVTASVDFPLGSGVMSRLPQLRLGPIDNHAAARVVCGLVAAERRSPARDLAEVLRRAYAVPAGADPVASNRARLVAVALFVAGPPAVRLAPEVEKRAGDCAASLPFNPTLRGRVDLAKHWSLSAAIAVTAGDDVGQALGEWKELADSRPRGSGFSFVDLAADRSGLAVGRRAVDKATAASLAERLARVREGDLLPVRALALSEGLSEEQFVARFGNIDSDGYSEAVGRIDAVLANTVGR